MYLNTGVTSKIRWSKVKVIWHRTRAVQWYSSGDASMHPRLIMVPWTHPTEHPKLHLDRYRRFTAECRITLHWAAISLSNCPLAWKDLIRGSLGPPESTTQTTSRSVQPFCTANNRDRRRYSMSNNRPHLASAATITWSLCASRYVTLLYWFFVDIFDTRERIDGVRCRPSWGAVLVCVFVDGIDRIFILL